MGRAFVSAEMRRAIVMTDFEGLRDSERWEHGLFSGRFDDDMSYDAER